jgi:hypothetical protein
MYHVGDLVYYQDNDKKSKFFLNASYCIEECFVGLVLNIVHDKEKNIVCYEILINKDKVLTVQSFIASIE